MAATLRQAQRAAAQHGAVFVPVAAAAAANKVATIAPFCTY